MPLSYCTAPCRRKKLDKDIIYLTKNVCFVSYSREFGHWLAGSKQLESLEICWWNISTAKVAGWKLRISTQRILWDHCTFFRNLIIFWSSGLLLFFNSCITLFWGGKFSVKSTRNRVKRFSGSWWRAGVFSLFGHCPLTLWDPAVSYYLCLQSYQTPSSLLTLHYQDRLAE